MRKASLPNHYRMKRYENGYLFLPFRIRRQMTFLFSVFAVFAVSAIENLLFPSTLTTIAVLLLAFLMAAFGFFVSHRASKSECPDFYGLFVSDNGNVYRQSVFWARWPRESSIETAKWVLGDSWNVKTAMELLGRHDSSLLLLMT